MAKGRESQAGFTLLELMLVTAVVCLLTAIALPSYKGYTERANRVRAIADIGGLQLKLYRWEGSNGGFPEELADAGLEETLDPWGKPYVYVNIATATTGEVRKDHNLHPLNTDFDLYSAGPDGKTATPLTAAISRDDIVRANNGGFIGIGQDY